MVKLYEIYNSLIASFSASESNLYGAMISDNSPLWLAIDKNGFPALLFPTSPLEEPRADIALTSIEVEFSRDCDIFGVEGQSKKGVFTLVKLNENDPDIVRLFLRLLQETFFNIQINYSNREIGEEILEIAELFREVEDNIKNVLGLWGELYIISDVAASLEKAVSSWCSHKNSKYDFVCDEYVIEAKSTIQPARKHRFSFDQLRPKNDHETYIFSLQLVQAPSGIRISEMFDKILERIKDDKLRKAFVKPCLAKGGKDIYRSEMRVQTLPSQSSLAVFEAGSVPVPKAEDGELISNIRFDVDLSSLQQLPKERLTNLLSFGT